VETKTSVRLRNGLQVDLRHVPEGAFGAALLYFTGSKEHNIELRRLAIEQGLSLNEYGLTRGETVVAARTEHDVYAALGLAWVPPELREARGEIAQAREGHAARATRTRGICAATCTCTRPAATAATRSTR
jgi:DNA polymerase (family 10)